MKASFLTGLVIVVGMGLSACSEKAADSLENTGSAIGNDVSRAVDQAGEKIDNGLDDAGRAIDEGANKMEAATSNATQDARREAREAKKDTGAAMERVGNDLKRD